MYIAFTAELVIIELNLCYNIYFINVFYTYIDKSGYRGDQGIVPH